MTTIELPKRPWWRYGLYASLSLALLVAAAYWGMRLPRVELASLQTASLQQVSVPRYYYASAQWLPMRQAQLQAPFGGTIHQLLREEGSAVALDEPLMNVQSNPGSPAAQQQLAWLQAKQALEAFERQSQRQQVEQLLAERQAELARKTALVNSGAISAAQAELEQNLLSQAQTQLRQLEQIEALHQSLAEAELAKARIEAQGLSLDLTSPMAGVLLHAHAGIFAGKEVQEGEELAWVYDPSELRLRIRLPSRLLASLPEKPSAEVETPAGWQVIDWLQTSLDPRSGEGILQFAPADAAVTPFAQVSVRLYTSEGRGLMLASEQPLPELWHTHRLQAGLAEPVEVRLQPEAEGWYRVLTPLAAGDVLVLDGLADWPMRRLRVR